MNLQENRHPLPPSHGRPLILSVILSVIIALFALEVARLYPFLVGLTPLPAGWFRGQALLYIALSGGGIVTTAAAFYGWRRWGVVSTVAILLIQLGIGQLLATGKPLEILMKAAMIALLVTFVGPVWKRMI